ncbi:hypothetical protein B0H12DRAFT_1147896 [Mycena haematopus]|nr:hypothetical protein B0H12DRAFT_1147896 [Mycena haematopus]
MAEGCFGIYVHAASDLIITTSILTRATSHPNIIQICGAASSVGMHAVLFNDDLIPLQQFLDQYQSSPILMVYIYTCCTEDFMAVCNYIDFAFQQWVYSLGCTKWIRRSTGRLCADLGSDDLLWLDCSPRMSRLPELYSLGASQTECIDMAIELLTMRGYHDICNWNLRRTRHITISADTTLKLRAVFSFASNNLLGASVEIASLSRVEDYFLGGWNMSGGGKRTVMYDGWTRFPSCDVFNNTLCLTPLSSVGRGVWLTQANYIFHCLHIVSNFEDYVLLESVKFQLHISETTEHPPEGFLFLCPKKDFQTGLSLFCWPACVGYWSLDPSGVDRLSMEDATRLGFPSFQFTTKAIAFSWDATVYEGLRQFHQAKGFDPESQDLARHLNYPLYRLSCQSDDSSAYMDGEEDADSDWDTTDSESEYLSAHEDCDVES